MIPANVAEGHTEEFSAYARAHRRRAPLASNRMYAPRAISISHRVLLVGEEPAHRQVQGVALICQTEPAPKDFGQVAPQIDVGGIDGNRRFILEAARDRRSETLHLIGAHDARPKRVEGESSTLPEKATVQTR